MKDKSVFINLLTTHYCKLHAFVMCLVPTKTDADDVMQETVLVMWSKFDKFQQGSNFLAWAKTIARYKILDSRKKNKLTCLLDDETLSLIHKDRERYNDNMDVKLDALRKCINKLPQAEKSILKLKYHKNMKTQQVARKIGIPLHTVYRRISKMYSVLLGCVQRMILSGGTS